MISRRETRKKARKIDRDVWKKHRPEIERLFLKEKRKLKQVDGEDGVIEIMKKQHGFTATEPQYESKLAEWRIRKNIKKEEWFVILSAIRRRAGRHKRSRVKFNNTVVDQDRVAREMARYRPKLEAENPETEGLSPQLPEHIDIYTPCSDLDICGIVREIESDCPSPGVGCSSLQPGQAVALSSAPGNIHFSKSFANYLDSLSWTNFIHWTELTQFMSIDMQLVRSSAPTSNQLEAIFHSADQLPAALARQDLLSSVPRFMIFSIINNMDAAGGMKVADLHRWLRCIPAPVLLAVFAKLPAPIFEVLREKVFAAALDARDWDTVQLMLQLGVDLRESVTIGGYIGHQDPLRWILVHSNNIRCSADGAKVIPMAKFIITDISRTATQSELNQLLVKILDCTAGERLLGAEAFELIRIPISFGAKPTVECFQCVGENVQVMRELAELRPEGAQGWLREGLFDQCIRPDLNKKLWMPAYLVPTGPRIQWALSYFLQPQVLKAALDDPKSRVALSNSFEAALEERSELATKAIFESCTRLIMDLACSKYGTLTAAEVMQWCLKGDYQTAIDTVYAYMHQPPLRPPPTPQNKEEQKKALCRAVSTGKLCHVEKLLEEFCGKLPFDLEPGLKVAARLGYDDIAVAIIHSIKSHQRISSMLILMEYGRTTAISAIICSEQHWDEVLVGATGGTAQRNFVALEDRLYRMPETYDLKEGGLFGGLATRNDEEQLALRALSYHAIHTGDYGLLEWLLQVGLVIDELWYCIGHDGRILSFFRPSALSGTVTDRFEGRLPSLLAVAAAQNNRDLILYLLNAGAENADTFALTNAVENNASPETCEMLLNALESRGPSVKKQYGSNALRAAIRKKNYTSLSKLAEKTDVNGVDPIFGGDEDVQMSLSPLGEAIVRCDTNAAQILLEKGAKPNALVSYSGIDMDNSKGAVLYRVSALLAAIATDLEDLPMIRLLISHGAEVDHPPQLGLRRTPIQRAAEIGNLSIVKFLLAKGAPVDGAPFYGGATALQLAAIGGYVGIVAHLLSHGADPNHAPAEGPGRTALEGAAEWGRTDTVLFLARSGVNLNLTFGDSNETQGERAARFAKERGHMALSRIIRELHRRYTQGGFQHDELFPDDSIGVMQGYEESASEMATWDPSIWESEDVPLPTGYDFDANQMPAPGNDMDYDFMS